MSAIDSNKIYDVVVLGGGPGGYVAAIRAAQLGLSAAVVEDKHLGGICLNYGCIPTKALLRSAEIYSLIKDASQFGIKVDNCSFDLGAIVKRSREVAAKLSKGVNHLLNKNKVDVFEARGKFNGKNKISLEKNGKKIGDINAKNIIIATGARAKTFPGLEPDGDLIVTYKEAMLQEKLPKSLLVVGSGAIGIEFASFFNSLGSKVTVVEIADRILPAEDAEIAALAKKSFEKQGMTILSGSNVAKLDKAKNQVVATISDKTGKALEHKFDKVILAVGIVANTENLGIEGMNIKINRAHIETNEYMQTGEPNIYAIGDVTAGPWLAHKASHEGVIAAEKIAAKKAHPIKRQNIPGCTYCHPQIASIGLTEEKAKEQGYDLKVGRFPFVGNGKAIAMGETEGLIKTIFDNKTGELLGAHLIGSEVTELISNFALGKALEATEQDFFATIFPHPTLSEMIHESVLDAFARAVHI